MPAVRARSGHETTCERPLGPSETATDQPQQESGRRESNSRSQLGNLVGTRSRTCAAVRRCWSEACSLAAAVRPRPRRHNLIGHMAGTTPSACALRRMPRTTGTGMATVRGRASTSVGLLRRPLAIEAARARSRWESLTGHTTGTRPEFVPSPTYTPLASATSTRDRRSAAASRPHLPSRPAGTRARRRPGVYPCRQEREQPTGADAKPSTSTSDAGLTRTPPPPACPHRPPGRPTTVVLIVGQDVDLSRPRARPNTEPRHPPRRTSVSTAPCRDRAKEHGWRPTGVPGLGPASSPTSSHQVAVALPPRSGAGPERGVVERAHPVVGVRQQHQPAASGTTHQAGVEHRAAAATRHGPTCSTRRTCPRTHHRAGPTGTRSGRVTTTRGRPRDVPSEVPPTAKIAVGQVSSVGHIALREPRHSPLQVPAPAPARGPASTLIMCRWSVPS